MLIDCASAAILLVVSSSSSSSSLLKVLGKGAGGSGEAVHITMVLQVVEQEEVQQVQIVALLGRGVVLPVDRRRRQELAHVLRVVRLLVRLQDRRAGERLAAHAAPERPLA